MKIAQVAPLYESVPPKYYGGTERVVSYLTEELVRQGHEVTLFASGDFLFDADGFASASGTVIIGNNTSSTDLVGPVSVAGVQQLFDDEGKCTDERIEKRIRSVATHLVDYIRDSICPRMTLESMVREDAS